MRPDSRRKVIASLHLSRMRPYLDAANGNERQALSLYRWHLELTAATQQILGVAEVILRNSIDDQLCQWNVRQGGGASWLLSPPESPLRSLTAGKRPQAFDRASKEAAAREPGHRRHGQAVKHDDVLAQVMFGMWKDLMPNHSLGASPETTDNKNRRRLWDEALRYAFPHEQDPDGQITYWRVAHMHRLRNRVSHMEPLLDEDVVDLMQEACALVGSIDPDVRNWVTGLNRVPAIVKQRPC